MAITEFWTPLTDLTGGTQKLSIDNVSVLPMKISESNIETQSAFGAAITLSDSENQDTVFLEKEELDNLCTEFDGLCKFIDVAISRAKEPKGVIEEQRIYAHNDPGVNFLLRIRNTGQARMVISTADVVFAVEGIDEIKKTAKAISTSLHVDQGMLEEEIHPTPDKDNSKTSPKEVLRK